MNSRIKRFALLIAASLGATLGVSAQSITLEQCLKAAHDNFPLQDQKILQADAGEALQKALWYAYIPQLSLGGQATYQSHVIELNVDPPTYPLIGKIDLNFIPAIPKFQYTVFAQATQVIWDGGQVKAGAKKIVAKTDEQQAQTDVELQKLQEGVTELYFALLLIEQQEETERILKEELERQEEKVATSIVNGMATENDRDLVRVELLKAKQRRDEIKESRKAILDALSIYTGIAISQDVTPKLPDAPILPQDTQGRIAPQRAEHRLLDSHLKTADAEWNAFVAKGMPTIALFARGGYGRPGLNMLDPDPKPFFIGGVTLSWDFGQLYGYSAQRRKRDNTHLIVELKRQALERELATDVVRKNAEAEQYLKMLEQDKEIVQLNKNISERNKLLEAEGSLSTTDFLKQLNNYSIVKLTQKVHKIQYIRALYKKKNSLAL